MSLNKELERNQINDYRLINAIKNKSYYDIE